MTVARARARYICSMAPRLLSMLFFRSSVAHWCPAAPDPSGSSLTAQRQVLAKLLDPGSAGLQNVRRPTPAARPSGRARRPMASAAARHFCVRHGTGAAGDRGASSSELRVRCKCPDVHSAVSR